MPVANVPLLDYTIEFLVSNGVQEIIVFCCAHSKMIEDYLRFVLLFGQIIFSFDFFLVSFSLFDRTNFPESANGQRHAPRYQCALSSPEMRLMPATPSGIELHLATVTIQEQ